MKIFFASDHHFWHKGINKLAKRPFDDLALLNRHMISCWNAVVTPRDHVYHLGDLSFGELGETLGIVKGLNGFISLIPGNHDRWLDDLTNELEGKLEVLPPLWKVNYNHTRIWLCHYPLRCWEGSFHGAMHLYGHTHNQIEKDRLPRSMEVSVDAVGFYPLYIADVWAKLDKEPILPEEVRVTPRDEEQTERENAMAIWRTWQKEHKNGSGT